MALSGLFLISFLIVHVGLNATVFNDLPYFDANDDGSMFNRAAYFMGNSLVIRIMEVGLFLFFILHIVQGYAVEARNRTRRQQGYKVTLGNRGSPWMSRSMALLGTLIFIFLVVHVAQFWVPSRITHDMPSVKYPDLSGEREMHNLFLQMYDTFQVEWVVILYLVGVAALAFHLFHGFHSAFRSLGVHNKKYTKMLKATGYGFTIVVSVLFALMPIAMYFGWIGPNN